MIAGGELLGIATRAEVLAALRESRPPSLLTADCVGPRRTIREAQNLLLQTPASMLLLRDESAGAIIGLLTLHDILRAQLAFADRKT